MGAGPANLDALARARIIHWRKAARMTQQDLARRIGRNTAWVSRYENAYFGADLDTLQRLTAAFNQSVFAALDLGLGGDEQRLLDGYRALQPASRLTVLALVSEWGGALALPGDSVSIHGSRPARARGSRAAKRGSRRG